MAKSSDFAPLFTIEFDRYREREREDFYDVSSARTFYLRMRRLSRNPHVIGDLPADWLENVKTDPVAKYKPSVKRSAPLRGVAPRARTRSFEAGRVIARFGHKNGVTPEMIAAINKSYEAENERQSLVSARDAWHAIRGFFLEMGMEIPSPEKRA